MFCSKCGRKIFSDAVICPYCGCATNSENQIIAENAMAQNKTKKLGVSFIICGAVNTVLSFVFACLANSLPLNRWLYGYRYSEMADTVFAIAYIHSGIAVVSIILLILGIILAATKKPLVNKKTQALTTTLMTVGMAVVNVLLLIPYIIFQIQY